MSYYRALGLTHEPFSTSPDPAFFFRSTSHLQALQRIEIAVRLRRGLCFVLGDVGTGKTTLARTLITELQQDARLRFHLVLDPWYETEQQFLAALCQLFQLPAAGRSTVALREAIEHHLFQQGVAEGRTTVLVIDEGQKLSPEMLEHLRVLLNYETNEYKLLQLVIFAQLELLPRLAQVHNVADRVAFKYLINPLDEVETAQLIRFRLRQAGLPEGSALFTADALQAIHEATQGYPRRIAMLCHGALEALVMHERPVADAALVRALLAQEPAWSTHGVA